MASSSPAPLKASPETRIITHMNADHPESLSLYLQHLYHLPTYRTRLAKMTEIDFNTMEVRIPAIIPFISSAQFYEVPITPPLETWADARPRLLAMDRSARAALDRSEASVKVYRPPDRPWMYAFLTFVLTVSASFSSRSNFLPGSLFYETTGLKHVDGFARFCYWFHPYMWAILIGLHALEVIVMSRGKLKRYNVHTGSWLWWKWVLGVSVEGSPCILRFNEAVAEAEQRLKKQQH